MNAIRTLLSVAALMLAIPTPASAAPSRKVIARTENALFEQMRCKGTPQVARAINTMLKNKLIRYQANESGVYLFVPNVPLKFLGFPIKHISGFDQETAFNHVPDSLMVGTAPPVFLEIDVAAPTSELKERALNAGLVEAVRGRGGFQISSSQHGYGSYLARGSLKGLSSIACVGG
jgi:hypothetical protein